VIILALVVCNGVQIWFLQTSLRRFSALVVVPIFQVVFTLLSTIGGAIYFQGPLVFSLLFIGACH
jgi:hypothetical protein